MRRTALFVSAATAGLAVALGAAGTASAHVSVTPGQAAQGGYARLAFRVPDESATASTVKVEVYLPKDQPVASVSTMPVPGWTVTLTKEKLTTPVQTDDGQVTEAVSRITWTAAGDAAIKPGEFQEFPVSLGPLPKTDKLVFKVLQSYSDGTVTRWIDASAPGGAEPEHPAPVLTLTPAAAASPSSATPATGSASTSSGGGLALGLAVAGLVAGLAGLVLGALALLRTRRAG
ncbi:MAG TPA: YcnI family protein [Micromonosporaceae bacterium]